MGSMKGKQAKIDAAFGRLADMIQSGNLLAGTDPVGFLDTVTAELKDLRAENVTLRSHVARLKDALREIRDYNSHKHPDESIIALHEAAIKESNECTACQHAKQAKWPPSGLCNKHYSLVTRAHDRVSQMFSYKQTWEPQEIARHALEEDGRRGTSYEV